jgi:SAM-dependent methyltransferase
VESGKTDDKRDVRATGSLTHEAPHFRMRKVARVIRRVAGTRQASLLDLGCGSGTLASLLPPRVRYHGIDIAIASPAPNLLEADIVAAPIAFGGRSFDIVVAVGLFEHLGDVQSRKLAEIAGLLADGGTFICTYPNFAHHRKSPSWPYSNVQPPQAFRAAVRQYFRIGRVFPTAYNWNPTYPNRALIRIPQERLNVNIPLISRSLAVDYCYVCHPLR